MANTDSPASVKNAALGERAAYTQRAILAAAEAEFSKRGLEGTRVRDIADAAGVNVATLYNYYKNKNALYEAVLEQGILPVVDIIKAYAGSHDKQSVQAIVTEIIAHLGQRPNVSRLIYLETIAEGPYLKPMAEKWFRPLFDEVLQELQHNADWGSETHPLLASLFIQLSFGHFALAPLLQAVFERDPLSADGLEQQSQFVELLLKQVFPDLA